MTDAGATLGRQRVICEREQKAGRVGPELHGASLTAGSAKILRAVFDAKTRLEFRLGGWKRAKGNGVRAAPPAGPEERQASARPERTSRGRRSWLTVFSLSSDSWRTSLTSAGSFFADRGARADSIFSRTHEEEPNRAGADRATGDLSGEAAAGG